MVPPTPPAKKVEPSSRTTTRTSNTNANPDTNEPPSRIRCTFSNCKFFFRTEQEMKKHKSNHPDHEYCSKCDLDCESEEQLLLHMIKSKKHIVCPICGIEFGSEGGRDRHIRQFHRTSQNLTCYGCQDTFRSAAGLMRHIEEGECVAISSDRLLFEQSKKFMQREALEYSAAPIVPSLVDADDDDDGGVPVPMTLGERNREAMANQPATRTRGGGVQSLIDEHWPKLGIDDGGLDDDLGDLMAFTGSEGEDGKEDKTKLRTDTVIGWHDKGRERTARTGTGTGSVVGSASGSTIAPPSTAGNLSIGPPDAGLVLQKIYRDWDPVNFLDPFTGEYVCSCGKRCLTKSGFEKHVLSKSQGSRRMQCPGCLKIFKSTAALIAHCESATTRCNVNEGNLYAKIIDEVSGGMIQTSGYNEDGTIRYVAGEVDLKKKTTIGVDLNKIGW